MKQKYLHQGETTWEDVARRVVPTVMEPYFPELVEEMTAAVTARKFMPGGRYLYATGKDFHQTQNCLLLRAGDSRVELADLMQRVASALMTGAGIGIVWSDLREEGALVRGMGGKSTGPLAFMQMVNEIGRNIMQGGSRRAAIWAGLHWNHPDVFKFARMKNWRQEVIDLKEKDFNFPAPMDMTNISVILDDDFFAAYEDSTAPQHDWAHEVYDTVIEQMLTTAEPGFSVDVGENRGENLRNACTEVTSADDNDICNLGSINLARVETIEEFERLVYLSTAFLMAGTLYSLVPYEQVAETREKNRRLGLGLMGIYDWLVQRGYAYEPNAELGQWLSVYATSTDVAADHAARLGVSQPVKTRAIAPTGTIGILAEVMGTGIEPLFAVAIKRRYLKGQDWHFQYVIDPVAQTYIDQGIDPSRLETAHDLARHPERRIAFQAWVQQYVDHGISSTLNLPSWDNQEFTHKQFGNMLYQHLPNLRGVTAYPDGARGGQPLNVVPWSEVSDQIGIEFEDFGSDRACVSGVCAA